MGTAWVKPNLAPAECPSPSCLPRDKNPSVWAQSSWCQSDAPAGMEHPSLGSCRSAPVRGGDPRAAPSLLTVDHVHAGENASTAFHWRQHMKYKQLLINFLLN